MPSLPLRPTLLLAALALAASPAHADWQSDPTSLAWKSNDQILWRFSFDKNKGKPFFDPLALPGKPPLTSFKPADHPWHYGLWFSWKYINHVNYWEENAQTGDADGITTWRKPQITTRPDGSASISLQLLYLNPKSAVNLSESRTLKISAPNPDGAYTIDWHATFTAGKDGATLDRTPMPGEPNGQVNGGYAGLSVRMAPPPLRMNVITTDGPLTDFPSSRARPNTPALACNFLDNDRDAGAIAFLSDPNNPSAHPATNPAATAPAPNSPPWYLVNDNAEGFRFMVAAILAPKVLTLKPAETLTLHYQLILSPKPFTPQSLKTALSQWLPPNPPTR